MRQLEEQQYKYIQCGRECHQLHEHVLVRELYTGHLGDIVHERFLRDECAEVADRGGQG